MRVLIQLIEVISEETLHSTLSRQKNGEEYKHCIPLEALRGEDLPLRIDLFHKLQDHKMVKTCKDLFSFSATDCDLRIS